MANDKGSSPNLVLVKGGTRGKIKIKPRNSFKFGHYNQPSDDTDFVGTWFCRPLSTCRLDSSVV